MSINFSNFTNTPIDLNTAATSRIFTDGLNSGDHNYYSFPKQQSSSFDPHLDDGNTYADTDSIQDTNGNSIFAPGEATAYSQFEGDLNQSINTILPPVTNNIPVYPISNGETEDKLTGWITPFDNAGNTLDSLSNTTLVNTSNFSNWVDGSANVQLQYTIGDRNTTNKSPDTDDNLSLSGELASGSVISPIPTDVSTQPTTTISKSTSSPTAITVQSAGNVHIENGTLRADTFTYQSGYGLSIYSGNGNVDFGSGARDELDLPQISSTTVSINYANTTTGGVIYNSGNGNRVYDAITFKDGSQILLTGIETLKFADTTINLSVVPNDPLFSQQWNLGITGVPDAWRFTTGSSKVLIGIEDTGLGTDSSGKINPDLRSTIFAGNNYLDESSSFSHGTQVEGVIAAASNNGIGISGINWNSDVFNIDVVGGDAGDYDLAGATQLLINQANSKGQRLVVNLSLAGGDTPAFDQLVANNQDKALFVFASGNGDTNSLSSPANLASTYSNVIAVGAVWGTKDYYGNAQTPGSRISYPNWWGSNTGNGLTLVAPSEFITTTATHTAASTPYNFGYGGNAGNIFNGTSAAVPNVTGIASLVWSIEPNLTATQVKAVLSETAYDLGTPGYDTTYGYGIVNADTAVRRAIALSRGAA
ncbi:MAG: S8 family serine peptidase [Rhizonema sp. NSF051]|nr:S8 family serine peptidase [Rhizonema sp. NSF051]